MKLGRNDLCLCGSGKKYKQCCLVEMEAAGFKYRQHRLIEEDLGRRLIDYALETLGESSINEAWRAFNDIDETEELNSDDPLIDLFLAWYLYHWELESISEFTGNTIETTIAESFWVDHEDELTDAEIAFLDAATGAPYSFHEVVSIRTGVNLRLRDLFTRAEYNVLETEVLKLQPGAILYSAMIEIGNDRLLFAPGPFELAPSIVEEVGKLRELIVGAVGRDVLSEADLQEAADDIRILYLNLLDDMYANMLRIDSEPIADASSAAPDSAERRRKIVLKILDNQIKADNPPETRQTLERLMKGGYSQKDARELIAHVLAAEIFYVLSEQQPFKLPRFISALEALPKITD